MFLTTIYKRLYQSNNITLILGGIVLPVFFSLMVSLLTIYFPDLVTNEDDNDVWVLIRENPYFILIYMLIIGPLGETAIQYIPAKLASFTYSTHKYVGFALIILSALVFALLHLPDLIYFVAFFLRG